MTTTIPPIHLHRSEAFAEDLLDLASCATATEAPQATLPWIVDVLPLAVALLGVAFAVIPPLS